MAYSNILVILLWGKSADKNLSLSLKSHVIEAFYKLSLSAEFGSESGRWLRSLPQSHWDTLYNHFAQMIHTKSQDNVNIYLRSFVFMWKFNFI